jgi:AcrR family transcriptional regulator
VSATAKKSTAMRRAPKQPRGARRIEVILMAAAELFDEVGYEAANTILIAKRAKTAVGSLYDFFPNKESIAGALVEGFTADLHTLMKGLIGENLVTDPLNQVFDTILDPLVGFINTRPGFRALYLRTPRIGQLSQAQQGLEEFFTQRIAALLLLRYPGSKAAEVMRVTKVCLETMKTLTALAIEGGKVDWAIVGDLKAMLQACVEANLEGKS